MGGGWGTELLLTAKSAVCVCWGGGGGTELLVTAKSALCVCWGGWY